MNNDPPVRFSFSGFNPIRLDVSRAAERLPQ